MISSFNTYQSDIILFICNTKKRYNSQNLLQTASVVKRTQSLPTWVLQKTCCIVQNCTQGGSTMPPSAVTLGIQRSLSGGIMDRWQLLKHGKYEIKAWNKRQMFVLEVKRCTEVISPEQKGWKLYLIQKLKFPNGLSRNNHLKWLNCPSFLVRGRTFFFIFPCMVYTESHNKI